MDNVVLPTGAPPFQARSDCDCAKAAQPAGRYGFGREIGIMDISESLLGSVVVAAIVGAIVTWISESRLADAKDIHDKELARLQNELGAVRSREDLRFTKLHEKQVDAVDKLWRAAIEAERAFSLLVFPGVKDAPTNPDSVMKAYAACETYRQEFEWASIYFDDNTCVELKTFDLVCLDLVRNHSQAFGPKSEPNPLNWPKLFTQYLKTVPPLKSHLRAVMAGIYRGETFNDSSQIGASPTSVGAETNGNT